MRLFDFLVILPRIRHVIVAGDMKAVDGFSVMTRSSSALDRMPWRRVGPGGRAVVGLAWEIDNRGTALAPCPGSVGRFGSRFSPM